LIDEFILGPNGLGNPNVSGFYLDDGWTNYSAPIQPWQPKEGFCDHSPIGGATEEDYYCAEDMGLTQADTTAITDAWRETMSAVHEAINAHGGWSWDQFHGISTPNKESCTGFFRDACSPGHPRYESEVVMHTLSWNGKLLNLTNDLVTFLLVRGDYAWIGYTWSGCSSGSEPAGGGGHPYEFPTEFKRDYGVPLGQCLETGNKSNVFQRQFSKVVVTMNCETYTARIDMKKSYSQSELVKN